MVSTTCDFGCTCVFSSGLWLTTIPTLASSGLSQRRHREALRLEVGLRRRLGLADLAGTGTDCAPLDT